MPADSPTIVGRSAEVRAVDDAIGAIADGPVAVLLDGELGIGKTTVWEHGLATAADLGHRVLWCRPVEAETQLGYAALADLLADVPETALEQLPPPQRQAIEVALLRAEPEGHGSLQRAVAVATLGVLRALASETPTLVAIDDVQWLDQPSANALGFALRRLTDERVGLLLARRTDGGAAPIPFDLDRALPETRRRHLVVGPLDRLALGRLVTDRLETTVSRATLTRLHRTTAGNPFFALEVGRALRDQSDNDELAIPASLAGLVGERLGQLPPAAREATELAAMLSRPTRPIVAAAVEGDGATAIVAAVAAGVLDADGERVRFSHPLLATVAYAEISADRRRVLHGRLAALVDDPEERARHLALATASPDIAIARELEEAAHRSAARGAPETAADLLEHARRLTPEADVDDALRIGIDAAERRFDAGYVDRAKGLLEELAAAAPTGAPRARVLARLGWVRAHAEGFHAGAESFAAAGREAFEDVALRIEVEEGLAWCLHTTAGVPVAKSHAATALELAEEHGEPSLLAGALSHAAFFESLEGNGMALDTIQRALELGHSPHWSQILGRPDWIHALLVQWSGDLSAALPLFERLYADAIEQGGEHALPFILFHLARVNLLLGDWGAARRHARECEETTVDSGQIGERPYSLAIEALVEAHLGLVEEAAAKIEAGLVSSERLGVRPAASELLAMRGFLELSRGEHAAADETFARVRELTEAVGLRDPALYRYHADAIETKIALGRTDDAQTLLDELDAFAERLGRPILHALADRCRALLSASTRDLDAAYDALARALELHPLGEQPFEEARTLLVLGSIQRRDKKKRATRETLGRALEIFDGLGAALWSERARAELARVGGRPSTGELTPTEASIAELIAAGRTYRETADALFISPKTVQWNLSKIYRKLGVRSRAELAARIANDQVPR